MIDYCTVLFDERERVLLPLHINSLRHFMSDTFNIKISVRPDDIDGIALCERFGVEVLKHPVYTQSPGKETGLRQAGYDTANRMDLLMKACTSDWVVISHLDIVWTGNTMGRAMPLMTDEYGVLGHHPHGSFAINRKAYNECHFGFWPFSPCGQHWISKAGAEWVKLVGRQERGDGDGYTGIAIPAVDIGILIEIEMQMYTYKWDRNAISHYHHIGGGSHHGSTGSHPGDYRVPSPSNEDLQVDSATTNRTNIALKKFKEFA